MLQGFLIGLGGESFFAAVRRGANLYFFTTGHHFYNRKPRNKYILLYSTLYSITSILLQKSLNLTPIQGFLGRLLQAALLRYYAFSSPADKWEDILARADSDLAGAKLAKQMEVPTHGLGLSSRTTPGRPDLDLGS